MHRLPVVYRPEARNDLTDIFRAVLRVSQCVPTAKSFVQRIKDRCSRIGDVPSGGCARDDLEPGLRTVPFEHSAVIMYRINPDRVRATNIFYGGRDYEALHRGHDDTD